MFQAAQASLAGTAGRVARATMEEWAYPAAQFDLVTSRLAVHYVADVTALFARVYQALAPGGHFVFSVEHPVITSCDRARPPDTLRQDWIVDDYFESGPRVTHWMGGQVVKYHRTVEEYFVALRAAGFAVDALRESRPQRAVMPDEATYRRRKRIPLMLFFDARRPEE
jgi:SAM-dependent methyltransferase